MKITIIINKMSGMFFQKNVQVCLAVDKWHFSSDKWLNLLVFGSGVSGKNSRLTGAKLHGVVGADELPLLKPLLLPKFSWCIDHELTTFEICCDRLSDADSLHNGVNGGLD